MSYIFISYKREDRVVARKLADTLEQRGWSVWWDPKLRAGERFDDVIETALQSAKCVIVLWSRRSVRSHYVRDEANYALDGHKLVPVAIERVELPFRFRGLHTPQLLNWKGDTKSVEFGKLIDDLVSILGPPAADAPYGGGHTDEVKAEPGPKIPREKASPAAENDVRREETRTPVPPIHEREEGALGEVLRRLLLNRTARLALVGILAGGMVWFGVDAWRAQIVREPSNPSVKPDHATEKAITRLDKIGTQESDMMDTLRRSSDEHLKAARDAANRIADHEASSKRLTPGTVFRDTLKDGSKGPEMVVIPAGAFWMGSDEGLESEATELPRHRVTIDRVFAMGKYEVTFDDYDQFAQATGREVPDDENWGRGHRPVIKVSWEDATAYTQWLSEQTGKRYRLPTEAEWEYAARAGTKTRYWWGGDIGRKHANCEGCGSEWDSQKTVPVGSFEANPFGLYDTAGNVEEWVQDCWHNSYKGTPTDGSAWDSGKCGRRVVRGGSWFVNARGVRSAFRTGSDAGYDRDNSVGFRLARDL